jgi:5-methyltetrahydropteroyltriglutamate--homocysteine methyltransferase
VAGSVSITTEPIGSIPRPAKLLSAMRGHAEGKISEDELHTAEDAALRDTINRFERTGSPIISDGEQTKPSFATYPLAGSKGLAPGGVAIPFADGHTRELPRLTAGPFHFGTYAVAYLKAAQQYTRLRRRNTRVLSRGFLTRSRSGRRERHSQVSRCGRCCCTD